MSFWQQFQATAGLGGTFQWFAILLVFGAFLLGAIVPTQRPRLRNAIVAFLFGVVGLLAAAFVAQRSGGAGGTYRWLRWAAWFLLGIATINTASVLLFDVVSPFIRLRIPRILRDLLIGFAYIVLGIVLLLESGVDLTGIVATSAVLTAVIGFSLQDTLGNVMGGMALQMDQTISVGDWIHVDKFEGQVKEIRWRQTSIETRDWDTVVIPNSVLMKSAVVILGRREGLPRQHRMWVYFNVDFRFAPTEVMAIVEKALTSEPIPNIAADPPPHCLVFEYQESYITYAARYWLTDLLPTDPTNSVVRTRIYAALERRSIPLSIPAHALFLTEDDSEHRQRKQQKEIAKREKFMRDVELFDALSDEELQTLAERLVPARFVRGEAIMKQGAEAHWLYILADGTASVQVCVADSNLTKQVADLKPGDFFGEMSLMTGAPRAATVTATTDAQCYRLDKATFQEVLQSRPEIAESISHALARRRVELDAVLEGLSEAAKQQRMRHTQHDFLDRIREFFML